MINFIQSKLNTKSQTNYVQSGNKTNKILVGEQKLFYEKELTMNKSTVEKEFPIENTVQSFEFTSSHQAMSSVLILAQIFAAMPIYGIHSVKSANLRFYWINMRMCYTFVLIIGICASIIIAMIWGSSGTLSLRRIEPIVWFTTKLFIVVNFILLARKWPTLMSHWELIEMNLPIYNQLKPIDWQFCVKIKWLTILASLLIFVEHSMSIAAAVRVGSVYPNVTAVQGYFCQSHPEVYYLIGYSGGFIEFWVEVLSYYCAFLWTFMDLFLVCIGICLTTRFRQFNQHLLKYKGLAMSKSFWQQQRESFSKLCRLVLTIDDAISVITAFSVTNNLYYILVQLLHTFHPKETIVENLYFWCSLLFLIGRFMVVTLSAAAIFDESKRPVNVIRAIPEEHYYNEAKRFLEEVVNNEVALTGMKFFQLKRTLILSVAGTIVTYELVLLQFQVMLADSAKILC